MSRGKQSKSRKLFDAETPFFRLPIVWITVIVIVALASFLAGWITWWSSPLLPSNGHHEGINELVTIFRLPLGLVALLIPILAVYATNHRSEQNLETMRLTRVQNNFTNYYTHLEEFLKYIAQFRLHGDFRVKERRLHALLFPGVKDGRLSINEQFLNELVAGLEKLLILTHQSTVPSEASALDLPKIRNSIDGTPYNIEEVINGIEVLYGDVLLVTFKSINDVNRWSYIGNESDFDVVFTHYSKKIIQLFLCVKYINHAISFDADISTPLEALLGKFDRLVLEHV